VSDSAIAVDFNHALDIKSYVTSEVTLNLVILFDLITELCYIVVGQILCAGIGIDTGLGENVISTLSADAVDIGESDLNSLGIRKIYAC
jgi:hypothetical protein